MLPLSSTTQTSREKQTASSLHFTILLVAFKVELPFFCFFGDKESSLQRLTKTREAELKYQSEQNSLDVSKTKEMAAIDTDKFQNMVSSIGADTIQAIATAGPEMQVCVISHDNTTQCNLSLLIQFFHNLR